MNIIRHHVVWWISTGFSLEYSDSFSRISSDPKDSHGISTITKTDVSWPTSK